METVWLCPHCLPTYNVVVCWLQSLLTAKGFFFSPPLIYSSLCWVTEFPVWFLSPPLAPLKLWTYDRGGRGGGGGGDALQ